HQVRPGNGQVDLMLDVLGKVVRIDKSISAGVHQLDILAVNLQWNADAIARHAGLIFHDADALAHQRIEQAGLADVGPADNRDNGKFGHVCRSSLLRGLYTTARCRANVQVSNAGNEKPRIFIRGSESIEW